MLPIKRNPSFWTPSLGCDDPLYAFDPFDRFFDDLGSTFFRRALSPRNGPGNGSGNGRGNGTFSPPVDIIQDENQMVLKAELPGVKNEDIEVSVHDDRLTLKGAKRSEIENNEEPYQYVERRYGEFARTFQLPATVDADKIRAQFKDGVLTVTLPVAEQAKPKRIEIKVK